MMLFFLGMLVGALLIAAYMVLEKYAREDERKKTLSDVADRRRECAKAYKRGKACMFYND